jgi:hypothetical protein
MSKYLIRRTTGNGGYVARPGHHHSYTFDVKHARLFPTREAAAAECCVENEIPIALEALVS